MKAWPVPDLDPAGTTAENARRILAVRMAEFYSFAPAAAREEASETLHEMRIAGKRLRYTLEIFRPVFGAAGERQIQRVKAVQEELGELHDHDVRIALIEDELTTLAIEQARAAAAAVARADAAGLPERAEGALRSPGDDPRRGLLLLLGQEHAGRRERFRRFRALWDRLAGEGMRADLAALSARPLPESIPAGVANDDEQAEELTA